MIILGIPVLEQHELTQACIASMVKTVEQPHLVHVVLIDNGSTEPYRTDEFQTPFGLEIIRYDTNQGFYFPLLELYNRYHHTAEFIGLMHNDVIFYEKGWERRMHFAFANDPRLGLLGLCGGWFADPLGGRGQTTVCNFRSDAATGVHGTQIIELVPAVLLDSLFMLFRSDMIPKLLIDDTITPCHFYDKIWSIRTIENQYHVAVLGIEIDHGGGNTSCSPAYQEDAKRWCLEHDIPLIVNEVGETSGDLALYKEAERRFLQEYREDKQIIPVRVDKDYKLWRF